MASSAASQAVRPSSRLASLAASQARPARGTAVKSRVLASANSGPPSSARASGGHPLTASSVGSPARVARVTKSGCSASRWPVRSLPVMPCPATPAPVAIVAQHGPDQVGVTSSTGTGARKPACPSAHTDGALCGPRKSNRTPSTPTTSTCPGRVKPEGSTMSSSPESPHLDNHHRNTLRQIFEHPVSHNIEWHAVTSLFDAIGTVAVHHDGKVTVAVGSERQIFDPPERTDIDVQMVVDLRHLLAKAGYARS